MGTGGSFPGLKWPRREVDHSSPSSAEIKNGGSYTCSFPICLLGVDRVKFSFTWIYVMIRFVFRFIQRRIIDY